MTNRMGSVVAPSATATCRRLIERTGTKILRCLIVSFACGSIFLINHASGQEAALLIDAVEADLVIPPLKPWDRYLYLRRIQRETKDENVFRSILLPSRNLSYTNHISYGRLPSRCVFYIHYMSQVVF